MTTRSTFSVRERGLTTTAATGTGVVSAEPAGATPSTSSASPGSAAPTPRPAAAATWSRIWMSAQ
jgi:hypothetical protein